MDYPSADENELRGVAAVGHTDAEAFDPVEDTEFNRKYPPDRFGEEASDTARVWKVYRDAATEADKVELDGWNKTLDVLLIFAGLFSAVSTAFIIESYKLLQQDSTDYIAQTLYNVLRTSNTFSIDVGSIELLAPGAGFTADATARWVNALWFVSLLLSLGVAFLCIMAKQWLDEYFTRVARPAETPRAWAVNHVLHNRGLADWRVGGFVALLPVGLHVSLFLFLAGLVAFLWRLDQPIAGILAGITGTLASFYVISNALPLFWVHCPWATALVRQVLLPASHALSGHVRYHMWRRVYIPLRRHTRNVALALWWGPTPLTEKLGAVILHYLQPRPSDPLETDPQSDVSEAQALSWMMFTALDQNVAIAALHALAGYSPSSRVINYICDVHNSTGGVRNQLTSFRDAALASPGSLSRHLRAALAIHDSIWSLDLLVDLEPSRTAPLLASPPLSHNLPMLLRTRTPPELSAYLSTFIFTDAEYQPRQRFEMCLQLLGSLSADWDDSLSPSTLLFLLQDWDFYAYHHLDLSIPRFLRGRIENCGWRSAQYIATHSMCLKCSLIELWSSICLQPTHIPPRYVALATRQLGLMLETHHLGGRERPPSRTDAQTQYFAAFVLDRPFSGDEIGRAVANYAARVLGCMYLNPVDTSTHFWYPSQVQALCYLILHVHHVRLPDVMSAAAVAVGFNDQTADDRYLDVSVRDGSTNLIPHSHPVYPLQFTLSRMAHITPPPSYSNIDVWSDPFCFLRPCIDGAVPLKLLIRRGFDSAEPVSAFARLLSTLAAQLCQARRRDRSKLSDVLGELLHPDYAVYLLVRLAGYGPGRDRRIPADVQFLRYAQHCREMAEQLEQQATTSWWDTIEAVAVEEQPNCRAYAAEMRRKLGQRGNCTICGPQETHLLEVNAE